MSSVDPIVDGLMFLIVFLFVAGLVIALRYHNGLQVQRNLQNRVDELDQHNDDLYQQYVDSQTRCEELRRDIEYLRRENDEQRRFIQRMKMGIVVVLSAVLALLIHLFPEGFPVNK